MADRSLPLRVTGVDFSGARDARENVWLAEAVVESGAPTVGVESCAPATTALAGHLDDAGDRAPDRGRAPEGSGTPARPPDDPEATARALADHVRSLPGGHVVACDFPFGLPRPVAAGAFDATTWRESLDAVAALDSGDALADACRAWAEAEADADGVYLKRTTDERTGAFSPYHFFVVDQTYQGMANVLAPLVEDGDAYVLPNDLGEADADRPWLLEVYPAAVFDALGCHRERYKGTGAAERERRAANLDGLRAAGLRLDDATAERAVANAGGDALDALAAAVGAARAVVDGRLRPDPGAWDPVECHIYR
ncbi:MAG: DUF429 domain-containing protein [Haloferacaceae archaeon]